MVAIEDIVYIPPPSIGHELGIMFGFLGLMAVTMGLYVVAWRLGNKRGIRKEQERVEALRAGGYFKDEGEKQDGEEEQEAYTTEGITTM